jgi:metal-responsive CopG/Arc/MetJ family transcriptional regulator
MKTIQMTIDESLLKAIDRLCRSRRTTRSALIRQALESELNRESVRALEDRQRAGYERHPVVAGEFDVWLEEQDWGNH